MIDTFFLNFPPYAVFVHLICHDEHMMNLSLAYQSFHFGWQPSRHEPERRTGLGIQATKAESRKPKAESGSCTDEARSRKPEAERRKPKAASRRPKAESRKPKAEYRKPNTEAMCEVCTKAVILRSTLNTSYITGLDMCKVCTEAVHSIAL